MLTASNLRKEFDSVVAVDDVSFSINRGEIFGLIGPNGAGKTTTIRIILNILEADRGTVTYDGKPFSDAVRNVIGFLPEERGLYKKSTVMDTILYFAELRGMKRSDARIRASAWLDRFGLNDRSDRKVEELSKGNQQKVQFVATIINDPALVVLDEPFSGLDPVNQIVFKEVFAELRGSGKAVVFSTHQMDQAERLSDTLCMINRGRVVLDGSVNDVKKRYGRNSVHVEFDGDGSFMKSLPGVKTARVDANAAELELTPDAKIPALITAMNGKVELRKFALVEPSLESIFIQIVGEVPPPPTSKEAA
jgi:ABC-2 type transport system ATP-binding protein